MADSIVAGTSRCTTRASKEDGVLCQEASANPPQGTRLLGATRALLARPNHPPCQQKPNQQQQQLLATLRSKKLRIACPCLRRILRGRCEATSPSGTSWQAGGGGERASGTSNLGSTGGSRNVLGFMGRLISRFSRPVCRNSSDLGMVSTSVQNASAMAWPTHAARARQAHNPPERHRISAQKTGQVHLPGFPIENH